MTQEKLTEAEAKIAKLEEAQAELEKDKASLRAQLESREPEEDQDMTREDVLALERLKALGPDAHMDAGTRAALERENRRREFRERRGLKQY